MRQGSIVILLCAARHLTVGLALIASSTVENVTAVHGVALLNLSHVADGVLVILAGLLGAATLLPLRRPWWTTWVMVLPQAWLLLDACVCAIAAIITGQFADGTVRDSWFLLADQGMYPLLLVAYSVALWSLHIKPSES